MTLQVEDFQPEIAAAVRHYEKFIVCIEKTPEDFLAELAVADGQGDHRL